MSWVKRGAEEKRGSDLINEYDSAVMDFADDIFFLDEMNIDEIDLHKTNKDTIEFWEKMDKGDGDTYHVDLVRRMMTDVQNLAPVIVGLHGEVFDGHHRLTAFNELGIKTIKVWRQKP